jgi:hypothetical protein
MLRKGFSGLALKTKILLEQVPVALLGGWRGR